MEEQNITIYKNRLLMRHKCIDYSIITYKYLKEKKYPFIESIQLKKHLINKDDPNYSPYHYYIEIKFIKNDRLSTKIIIDNEDLYNYHFYKSRYSPKCIQKLKHKAIINAYNSIDIDNNLKNIIINDVEFKIQELLKYKK